MRIGEHWNDYPPDDPAQGSHWCSNCCQWDEDCECPDPGEADSPHIEAIMEERRQSNGR